MYNASDVVATDRCAHTDGTCRWSIEQADVLDWLSELPSQSVDLVITSPPYEGARLYLEGGTNLGIARKTEVWVAWMTQCVMVSLRVCRGLVAFVVEGQTKKYRWTAGPALLMADLHRAGVSLRKPPAYHRIGIPGSGGPDWLRNDYEFIVCCTNGGKLPWSNNVAMGHRPKWAPGGDMSYRLTNGERRNQWGSNHASNGGVNGTSNGPPRKSHKMATKKAAGGRRVATAKGEGGEPVESDAYLPPALANPGNVIKCKVGGGLLGSPLAHENEAPFPQSLVDFFVLSFCPPGGIVCDPFAGSGTTIASAVENGRRAIGCDIRASQVEIVRRRLAVVTPKTLFEEQ